MHAQFIGYATDCVIAGEVELDSDRLTDLLTGQESYVVTDASVEVLDDERVMKLPTVDVPRDDLCVVVATEPRGNAKRRIRTRSFPIRATVGPYEVFGYIHAMPTANPVSTALRRQIIPMTSGWISYRRAGEVFKRPHEGMLLNRAQIEWLEQATDEDALLGRALDMPVEIDMRVEI